MYAIRNAIITQKIDDLVAQGMNKTKAVNYHCAQPNKIIQHWNIHTDRIKKIYYATKKKKPEIYVREYADSFEMYAYPAKCVITENGKDYACFGLLGYRIPKKDLTPTSGELHEGAV